MLRSAPCTAGTLCFAIVGTRHCTRVAGWSDTQLAQHGLQQEKSGGSKPGLRRRWRDRGETGSGGRRATQCNSHLPICLQCPSTSHMSALNTISKSLINRTIRREVDHRALHTRGFSYHERVIGNHSDFSIYFTFPVSSCLYLTEIKALSHFLHF